MNNKTLYLQCSSGISGDMMVGALIDLGADTELLNKTLKSIPIDGYKVIISRVIKSGLDVCDFNVILDSKHENHDHDMDYLHGQVEEHQTSHNHEHRSLSDIRHILGHTDMSEHARELADRIFTILAKAEAKAHGTTIEKVHFHEVGAVDSIVDIVAAAVCLDNLNVKECIIPELSEGKGFVRCQHGVLPVPVPAVLNIVEDSGLSLSIMDVEGEFVTPTGAAIAAAIKTSDTLPSRFNVISVGMGGGKREYERPSILRAMFIEPISEGYDYIYKLESNIDDCAGEALGYVMERLLEAGARDVHYTPVYMKKNRPAYQLNVICTEQDIDKLEQIIFAETTTIGIRRQKMERTILKRRNINVMTSLGEAQVKVCDNGGKLRYYPEYESVAHICRDTGYPYQEVYALIMKESNENNR